MKVAKSIRDLAVNGAPPAFAQPLHVGRPNLGDKSRFFGYCEGIFERAWLTNNGPLLLELEDRIARIHCVKNCVAMSNGTIALEVAIRAMGLNGEVIVPSYTFIATAHALHWQGITPVFADIDSDTHNLSPEAVRRMITPRTSGIIGVHLWGRPAPVAELTEIADEHSLQIMFDASHAFACRYKGQPIGSFGRCEVLSFHATKVFNTFEGGAVLTNDDELAERMRLMRNFGFKGYDNVIYPGINGKLSEISAAMGLSNLELLKAFVAENFRRHRAYDALLSDANGIKVLKYSEADSPNYHYSVIEVDDRAVSNRDQLVAILHAENILARKYFWPGCHQMKPYRDLYPHSSLLLKNTIDVAERVIVLPNGSLSDDELTAITSIIRVAANESNGNW